MPEYGIFADGRVVDVTERFNEIRKWNPRYDYKDIRDRLQDEMGIAYTILADNEEEASKVAPEILKELGY